MATETENKGIMNYSGARMQSQQEHRVSTQSNIDMYHKTTYTVVNQSDKRLSRPNHIPRFSSQSQTEVFHPIIDSADFLKVSSHLRIQVFN